MYSEMLMLVHKPVQIITTSTCTGAVQCNTNFAQWSNTDPENVFKGTWTEITHCPLTMLFSELTAEGVHWLIGGGCRCMWGLLDAWSLIYISHVYSHTILQFFFYYSIAMMCNTRWNLRQMCIFLSSLTGFTSAEPITSHLVRTW